MSYTIEIVWVDGVTDEQRKEGESFVLEIKNEIENEVIPAGVKSVKIIKDEDAAQA